MTTQNRTNGFSACRILLAISILLIFLGCNEKQINPMEDTRGIYSIYGALNMEHDLHYIRVKDLKIPLASDSSKNIDATVLFEDLESGIQKILQDTVVEFSGNYTHNYILNENLGVRNPYQITVTRSDGNSVSSIATTPGITSPAAIPSENVGCFQPMVIQFDNVLPSEQIRYEVGFEYNNDIRWLELSRICPLTRIQNENSVSINLIPLDLIGAVFPSPGVDRIACDSRLARIGCNDLDSEVVRFRYLHLGPEWQNVYPLYPVDPEDIGDVNNGLGFFGAYRSDSFNFTVNTQE